MGLGAEWIALIGLLAYSVLVCLLRSFRVLSEGGVFAAAAIPCLVAALWHGWLYLLQGEIRLGWGLVLGGLGWLCAGMTFISSARLWGDGGWHTSFLGWLATCLIIVGGITGWLSIREEQIAASAREHSERAD